MIQKIVKIGKPWFANTHMRKKIILQHLCKYVKSSFKSKKQNESFKLYVFKKFLLEPNFIKIGYLIAFIFIHNNIFNY